MTRRADRRRAARVGGGLSVFGAALLVAACFVGFPKAAYAANSVTPNSNLQDGQTVQIHVDAGTYDANATIKVVECIHNPQDPAFDCDGFTNNQITRSAADGSFDKAYVVHTLPNDSIGDSNSRIMCDNQNPCDLYVGQNYNDFNAKKVLLPITFGVAAATTTSTSTTTTSTTTTTTSTSTTTTSTTNQGATTTTTSDSTTTTTAASAASAGATTTSTSTSAQTSSTTATTLGVFGNGFTVSAAPAGPADPGLPPSDRSGAAAAGTRVAAASVAAPVAAADPTSGRVAFTGAGMAPWMAMLGLIALFGGSLARRALLRTSTNE